MVSDSVMIERPINISQYCVSASARDQSGFFATACRWSSAELVQVLKVVSDNSRNTAKGLSAKLARSLMSDALETLERLLAGLEARAKLLREIGDRRDDG